MSFPASQSREIVAHEAHSDLHPRLHSRFCYGTMAQSTVQPRITQAVDESTWSGSRETPIRWRKLGTIAEPPRTNCPSSGDAPSPARAGPGGGARTTAGEPADQVFGAVSPMAHTRGCQRDPRTLYQTITGWLASEGFRVNRVSNGRTVIEFSGTAGLVRQAFHTETISSWSTGKSTGPTSAIPRFLPHWRRWCVDRLATQLPKEGAASQPGYLQVLVLDRQPRAENDHTHAERERLWPRTHGFRNHIQRAPAVERKPGHRRYGPDHRHRGALQHQHSGRSAISAIFSGRRLRTPSSPLTGPILG